MRASRRGSVLLAFALGLGGCWVPWDADGDQVPWTQRDCDDQDPSVYPGADEVCDGVDNDCNEKIDEGVLELQYQDADGDGLGDPAHAKERCPLEAGWVSDNTDCDDSNPASGAASTWYQDYDQDGYGDPNNAVSACEKPDGHVGVAGDCVDTDATVPRDGGRDDDGDGYFSAVCEGGDDCNDDDPTVYPGAPEVCDNQQNDCKAGWQSDDGVVHWLERTSGEMGSSCSVGSHVEDVELTEGCQIVSCKDYGPDLGDGSCCACELTESFATDELNPVKWAMLPEDSAELRFCAGTYHADLILNNCSDGPCDDLPELIVIGGPVSAVEEDGLDCVADESPMAVLQGSGTQATIHAEVWASLTLEIENLVVTSAKTHAGAWGDGSRSGGIYLNNAKYAGLSGLCLRGNGGSAGGGLQAYGVEEIELSYVVLRDNVSWYGAGMNVQAGSRPVAVDLDHVSVLANNSESQGGGIALIAGDEQTVSLDARYLLLADNTAVDVEFPDFSTGGGLLLGPAAGQPVIAEIRDSDIRGNQVHGVSLIGEGPDGTELCSCLSLDRVNFSDNLNEDGDDGWDVVEYEGVIPDSPTGKELGPDATATYATGACGVVESCSTLVQEFAP